MTFIHIYVHMNIHDGKQIECVYIIISSSFIPGWCDISWFSCVTLHDWHYISIYHSVLSVHIAGERHHSEISSCNRPLRHWESSQWQTGDRMCVTWEYNCPKRYPQSTIFIWWVNTLTEHMLWPHFPILTICWLFGKKS